MKPDRVHEEEFKVQAYKVRAFHPLDITVQKPCMGELMFDNYGTTVGSGKMQWRHVCHDCGKVFWCDAKFPLIRYKEV